MLKLRQISFVLLCILSTFLGWNSYGSVIIDDIPLVVTPYASLGYASLNASVVTPGVSAPSLSVYTGGITVGYLMANVVLFGLSSDFTFINQYSNPANNGGNYRGTRWNIVSPTLGLQLLSFTLLADFEFLGNYNLKNADANGNNVSFTGPLGTGPLGVKLRALYSVFNPMSVGVLFEYLSFNTISNSGFGNQTLSPALSFWQTGLIASFGF